MRLRSPTLQALRAIGLRRAIALAIGPLCERLGCGRRAYYRDDVLGLRCCLCVAEEGREWAAKYWGGPSAGLRFPLQQHLGHACGAITMLFVFGDGWQEQCLCTRCNRRWFDGGWICPVDYHRARYLRMLDEFYDAYSFGRDQLAYVGWDAAVLALHEMLTGVTAWELDVILEFADASAAIVDPTRPRATLPGGTADGAATLPGGTAD